MTARHWFRVLWMSAGLASIAWLVRGYEVVDLPDEMYRGMPEIDIERYAYESRFLPKEGATKQRKVGLAFFPGALVSPLAYDPLARRVARQGFPVLVLHLPTLPFGAAAADEVISRALDRTQKGRWVFGGHSRGAVVACQFAALHPGRVAGLILVGTTHPRDQDLSEATYPAVKIMGSADGVAPLEESERNASKLPPRTRLVTIAGGNHAQFGYYRYQLFDGAATIDRETQQARLTQAVLEALEESEKEVQ